MGKTVTMNLKVDDYTSRVLGVIKEKYGLRDKSQALEKFAEMYGEAFVDLEVQEEIVKQVLDSSNRHIKKYGFRSRSVEDLRKKLEGR